MILDHCVSLLSTGHSEFQQQNFTNDLQIIFKLQSGVTAKKLDSIKTALMMLEVMKITQDTVPVEHQLEQFSHFIHYIDEHFTAPVAMALIQYAVRDRELVIKQLTKSEAWKYAAANFKPVMLHNSKDPKEVRKYQMFERFYKKLLKALPLSKSLNQYLAVEMRSGDMPAFSFH